MAWAIGNKLGNKIQPGVGINPLKIPTPEILREKVDQYFDSCYEIDPTTGKKNYIEPITMSGLANHLEIDLNTLRTYATRDAFRGTMKYAKMKVLEFNEQQLFVGKNVNGVIFNMLNNFKEYYTDTRTAGNQQININVGPQKSIEEREGNFEALSEAVTENKIEIVSEQ